jgi:hypothetical protein
MEAGHTWGACTLPWLLRYTVVNTGVAAVLQALFALLLTAGLVT